MEGYVSHLHSFLQAIRYSKELAGHFGIKVGQMELLGSMNIGLLNDMVASSSKFGNLALESQRRGRQYILLPEMNLTKPIALGEVYTTNASPPQSRIWLSHVCIIFLLLNIHSDVVKCRYKLKRKAEVLVERLCTGNCNLNLTDYSWQSTLLSL